MRTQKRFITSSLPICLCLLLALTLWAPARAASDTDYQTILKVTLNSIHDTITDPCYESIGGEWAVLALARGGIEDNAWYGKYMDNLIAAVEDCDGLLDERKYTEYSRVVLGLSSIGQDATKLNTGNRVYDLVSPLLSKQTNGEYWASWQGNNGTAFAIIALDSQNYFDNAAGKAARAGLLDALINAQGTDGGWNISASTPGNGPDVTAMALQAMAPYYLNQSKYNALGATHTYAQLQSCVTKALNNLTGFTADDFGNVEAAAQVTIALAALNRDAANDALLGDVLSSVLAYYDGAGGFKHLKDGSTGNNQMSTEQAAHALVAYDRWKNGKNSLFNMTDRGMVSEITINAPSTVTVEQTVTGSFQVTSSVPCIAVAQKADGTFACLTPEGSGTTRTFHTVQGAVTVMVRGDANGDGTFNGSDITRAKAAYLGKTTLDALHQLAADANRDQVFNGSDITRAKAAYLGKTNLDW